MAACDAIHSDAPAYQRGAACARRAARRATRPKQPAPPKRLLDNQTAASMRRNRYAAAGCARRVRGGGHFVQVARVKSATVQCRRLFADGKPGDDLRCRTIRSAMPKNSIRRASRTARATPRLPWTFGARREGAPSGRRLPVRRHTLPRFATNCRKFVQCGGATPWMAHSSPRTCHAAMQQNGVKCPL
jgi:hypothetical protein